MDNAKQRFYAGIGSRKTPNALLRDMYRCAKRLAELGFVLRSGAAPGADSAFEEGAKDGAGAAEIFVPWDSFQKHSAIMPSSRVLGTPEQFDRAQAIAALHHPAWTNLKDSVKRLHSRNVFQCFGLSLDQPDEFILCWTPDGCTSSETRTRDSGGTGMAISIASSSKIPVINMANPGWIDRLTPIVKGSTP